jgi:hypothetical protein
MTAQVAVQLSESVQLLGGPELCQDSNLKRVSKDSSENFIPYLSNLGSIIPVNPP